MAADLSRGKPRPSIPSRPGWRVTRRPTVADADESAAADGRVDGDGDGITPLASAPDVRHGEVLGQPRVELYGRRRPAPITRQDRKSTRLNSSHVKISYAVFCLKKKNK